MILARAFSLIFLGTIICSHVHAAPQFLVWGGKPKCHLVEVPKETSIKIHYEAPEIDSNNHLIKQGPSFLTVMEKPIETLEEQRLEHEHATNEGNVAKVRAMLHAPKHRPKVVSQELTDGFGSFVHTTHSEDAVVEVCIRTKGSMPMIFHLRVEELEEDVLDEFEKEKKAENGVPLLSAEHHWSFMETQLDRIEHEMHNIIKEADFFRERDALYHQHTDDLHKATLFWPILHCCILVVTGFTQANHIISFFKSRRII